MNCDKVILKEGTGLNAASQGYRHSCCNLVTLSNIASSHLLGWFCVQLSHVVHDLYPFHTFIIYFIT